MDRAFRLAALVLVVGARVAPAHDMPIPNSTCSFAPYASIRRRAPPRRRVIGRTHELTHSQPCGDAVKLVEAAEMDDNPARVLLPTGDQLHCYAEGLAHRVLELGVVTVDAGRVGRRW